MVPPAVRPNYQVVDLTIDEEYEAFSEDVASQDTQYREPTNEEEDYNLDDLPAYDYTNIDNQGVIDLTAIPDIDVPPSEHYSLGEDADSPGEMVDAELITEAVCLQLVLDVLPDVSVDHVLTIIQEKTTDLTRTKEHSEWIVNELLESTYPKEADVASKKRKREDSEGPSDYEGEELEAGEPSYKKDALNLLKDEFLNVPARHIENTFKQKKTLFKSYIVLEDQVRKYQQATRTFIKSPRPRNKRGIELLLIESGSRLPKELRAAKEKTEHEAVKRRKLEDAKQVEEDNLQQAMTEKLMRECQCCFTEYPLNRMVSCSGRKPHLFCMDCPRQYIETEMGQSKCRPVCFASTECNGTFSRAQLQQILDRKSFERLEHMQQQQDIAAAGLDFLSECPFCDYKAECLPVEQDKEFRCQNTKCSKTSCRLCDKETHVPLSCEEVKKNEKLTLRHVVEEAMSAALIRKCNKCQHPFIKEYGCNKMSCSHCGNKQCYICSKTVSGYEHFGDTAKGRCALHDNVEDVHEQAVKKAAKDAMAQIRAEDPTLSDADLMIQVSDRVKQGEAVRRERANERLNEFPYAMVGDRLAYRNADRAGDGLVHRPERHQQQGLLARFEAVNDRFAVVIERPGPAHAPNRPMVLPPHGLQYEALAQPQAQLHAHEYDQNAMGPLPPFNPHAQAAQDPHQGAQNAQELLHRLVALQRQLQQRLPGEANGLPVYAHDVNVGADAGRGVAFGGPHANRAMGMRRVNDWIEEHQRNMFGR